MKYELKMTAVDPFEVCRPRATEGSATVISVPSSCSSAAAAVHAASLLHAPGGSGSRTRLARRACERLRTATDTHYAESGLSAKGPADENVLQPVGVTRDQVAGDGVEGDQAPVGRAASVEA